MAELPDHGQAVFPREGIERQLQCQAAIAADLCRLRGEHRLAHGQQRRASLLLVSMGDTRQRKRREAVPIGMGVLLDGGNIRAIPGDPCLRFRDLLRKALADGVLQRVFLRKMVGFQQLQLGHLNVQVHFFFNHGVAAGQCLDLGIRKRLFVYIFGGADRRFAGHDLADKFLLALHKLVKVGVEGALGDIAVNVHLRVFVALPDNAPLPLLKVGRTPRTIQMVQGDELLLAVGAGAHALGAAQQDTHLTAPHLAKQIFLLYLALGVVDKGDLVFGNTQFQQLRANIIINAEGSVILWGGEVAKNHLRGALASGALPDLKHIFRALGGFAVGIAGKHGVDQPLIQRQLAAIVGDEQHIVHAAVHLAVADFLSTLRQRRHDLFLILGGFQGDVVVMRLRHGQLEHIRRLDVRHIFEYAHQLRQVIKLGKPCLGPVAGTLRGQLDGGDGLAVVRRPCVKVLQALFLQGVHLQIPLDGVKLHHAVGNGGAGGKDNAAPSGDLVEVAALHKEV